MDVPHGKKKKEIGSHLHLNPGGIKPSMNHADAAESCVTPTTGGACLWGGWGGGGGLL